MADGEGSLRGLEPVSVEMLMGMVFGHRSRRTLSLALPGSDELRFLDVMGANASAGGEDCSDIILREDVRKIEVGEEYLHGTQARSGIIGRLGRQGAEVHVKEFLIRHRRLLGISDEAAAILGKMLERC